MMKNKTIFICNSFEVPDFCFLHYHLTADKIFTNLRKSPLTNECSEAKQLWSSERSVLHVFIGVAYSIKSEMGPDAVVEREHRPHYVLTSKKNTGLSHFARPVIQIACMAQTLRSLNHNQLCLAHSSKESFKGLYMFYQLLVESIESKNLEPQMSYR